MTEDNNGDQKYNLLDVLGENFQSRILISEDEGEPSEVEVLPDLLGGKVSKINKTLYIEIEGKKIKFTDLLKEVQLNLYEKFVAIDLQIDDIEDLADEEDEDAQKLLTKKIEDGIREKHKELNYLQTVLREIQIYFNTHKPLGNINLKLLPET